MDIRLHYVVLKLCMVVGLSNTRAQEWNKLPLDIKSISNMVGFSLKVKNWLLEVVLVMNLY